MINISTIASPKEKVLAGFYCVAGFSVFHVSLQHYLLDKDFFQCVNFITKLDLIM